MLVYMHMMTHVEVTAGPTENPTSLLRRFTRSGRSSGVVQSVKSRRYFSRASSTFKTKAKALRRIENIKAYNLNVKLGKIEPKNSR